MWRRKPLVFLGHADHVSELRARSAGLNDLLPSQESRTERGGEQRNGTGKQRELKGGDKDIIY